MYIDTFEFWYRFSEALDVGQISAQRAHSSSCPSKLPFGGGEGVCGVANQESNSNRPAKPLETLSLAKNDS